MTHSLNMYGPVPLAVRTYDLSLAWAASQSLSRIPFVANAILLRKATSGAHMSNSTVSLSMALIWLNSPA